MIVSKSNVDVRILASGVLVLVCVLILIGLKSRQSVTATDRSFAIAPSVETVVRKLLTQYHLDERSIITRKITSSDGNFARAERRIMVPADFNTFAFNHDLRQAVAALGASAIATEKSEDRSVTMHVKKNNVILQSLIFIPQKKDEAN